MLIHLFSLSFIILTEATQLPNFYPSYASAREASRNMQKELVVFFSDKSCEVCEEAWSAFVKNEASSKQYVFTRLDIRDFDGGVFFEHFDFKQVPAWVILTPEAIVKEKWEGAWKGSGKLPSPTPAESKPVHPASDSNPNSPTTPTTKAGSTSPGFVLQAGYFGSETNANKMLVDLKTAGYSDFKIEPVQKDGSIFYRVISREYFSENEVNAEQVRLNTLGIKTSVKK